MTTISATLNWDGVWDIKEDDIPSNIPDEEGIYMILYGRRLVNSDNWDRSSYKLIYIGESEKVRSRIAGHEKWSCWKSNCEDHILLKVATCEFGTSKRQKVECCLINNTKPICNDECKDDYPYKDDTVEIKNTGMSTPLKDGYIC